MANVVILELVHSVRRGMLMMVITSVSAESEPKISKSHPQASARVVC
jgi:hypothetical protein